MGLDLVDLGQQCRHPRPHPLPDQSQKKINQGYPNKGLLGINTSVMYQTFSSYHPGGMNAAFCDGSVKFLKDTIDTTPYDASTGLPVGMTADANGILQFARASAGASGSPSRPATAARSSAPTRTDTVVPALASSGAGLARDGCSSAWRFPTSLVGGRQALFFGMWSFRRFN